MTRRFSLEEEEVDEIQPGRWARFKEYIGLGGDYDDEEEEMESSPAPAKRRGQVLRLQQGRTHQIHKISIHTLEDARFAADMLKERRPVILNLEQTDEDVARRAIDFVSGATYALDGYYERVGEKVFLFTPSNTLISTEEDAGATSARGLYMRGE